MEPHKYEELRFPVSIVEERSTDENRPARLTHRGFDELQKVENTLDHAAELTKDVPNKRVLRNGIPMFFITFQGLQWTMQARERYSEDDREIIKAYAEV